MTFEDVYVTRSLFWTLSDLGINKIILEIQLIGDTHVAVLTWEDGNLIGMFGLGTKSER